MSQGNKGVSPSLLTQTSATRWVPGGCQVCGPCEGSGNLFNFRKVRIPTFWPM